MVYRAFWEYHNKFSTHAKSLLQSFSKQEQRYINEEKYLATDSKSLVVSVYDFPPLSSPTGKNSKEYNPVKTKDSNVRSIHRVLPSIQPCSQKHKFVASNSSQMLSTQKLLVKSKVVQSQNRGDQPCFHFRSSKIHDGPVMHKYLNSACTQTKTEIHSNRTSVEMLSKNFKSASLSQSEKMNCSNTTSVNKRTLQNIGNTPPNNYMPTIYEQTIWPVGITKNKHHFTRKMQAKSELVKTSDKVTDFSSACQKEFCVSKYPTSDMRASRNCSFETCDDLLSPNKHVHQRTEKSVSAQVIVKSRNVGVQSKTQRSSVGTQKRCSSSDVLIQTEPCQSIKEMPVEKISAIIKKVIARVIQRQGYDSVSCLNLLLMDTLDSVLEVTLESLLKKRKEKNLKRDKFTSCTTLSNPLLGAIAIEDSLKQLLLPQECLEQIEAFDTVAEQTIYNVLLKKEQDEIKETQGSQSDSQWFDCILSRSSSRSSNEIGIALSKRSVAIDKSFATESESSFITGSTVSMISEPSIATGPLVAMSSKLSSVNWSPVSIVSKCVTGSSIDMVLETSIEPSAIINKSVAMACKPSIANETSTSGTSEDSVVAIVSEPSMVTMPSDAMVTEPKVTMPSIAMVSDASMVTVASIAMVSEASMVTVPSVAMVSEPSILTGPSSVVDTLASGMSTSIVMISEPSIVSKPPIATISEQSLIMVPEPSIDRISEPLATMVSQSSSKDMELNEDMMEKVPFGKKILDSMAPPTNTHMTVRMNGYLVNQLENVQQSLASQTFSIQGSKDAMTSSGELSDPSYSISHVKQQCPTNQQVCLPEPLTMDNSHSSHTNRPVPKKDEEISPCAVESCESPLHVNVTNTSPLAASSNHQSQFQLSKSVALPNIQPDTSSAEVFSYRTITSSADESKHIGVNSLSSVSSGNVISFENKCPSESFRTNLSSASLLCHDNDFSPTTGDKHLTQEDEAFHTNTPTISGMRMSSDKLMEHSSFHLHSENLAPEERFESSTSYTTLPSNNSIGNCSLYFDSKQALQHTHSKTSRQNPPSQLASMAQESKTSTDFKSSSLPLLVPPNKSPVLQLRLVAFINVFHARTSILLPLRFFNKVDMES